MKEFVEILNVLKDKDKHNFQGTLAIGQSGKVLFYASDGQCRNTEKCQLRTQYCIGSITKQFTSVAVLRAILDIRCKGNVERLKIELNQPIIAFIPSNHVFWGAKKAPEWAYKVTIHHLLSNTSGLKDADQREYIQFGKYPRSRNELAAFYNNVNDKLLFKPGTRYQYSNPNFFFAGLIVEVLSDKTLGQYIRETFFEPLGMKDTYLPETGNIKSLQKHNKSLSSGFQYSFKDSTITPVVDYFPSDINQGDGGIISTVPDLILWNKFFFETERVLPKPVKMLMLQPTKLCGDEMSDYGYGISVLHNGMVLYSHEGLVPGYQAVMYYDPSRKVTLVHLSNLTPNVLEYLDIMERQNNLQLMHDIKDREEQAELLKREYPIAEEQYEKHRLIKWEDFELMINSRFPINSLHLEQEKLLYAWNKKLLEDEHARRFAKEYREKRPNAEKNGYGPFALVPYAKL